MANGRENNMNTDYNQKYEAKLEELLAFRGEHLKNVLKEKRAFGVKKYGETSFQLSEENSKNVDELQHALEEVADLLNYLAHGMYKAVEFNIGSKEFYENTFKIAEALYYIILSEKANRRVK